MGIVNIVAKIKQIHPEYVALINIGTFYYVYGKDAYILSYMFKYKLMKVKNQLNQEKTKLKNSFESIRLKKNSY